MTKTRLRQIVLVARELEPVAQQLEDALGVRHGFNDPGVAAFGLRNVVYSAGASFVEVVVPVQDDTSAGRMLDGHGEGGYMAIFQVTDIAAARRRVDEAGIRVVWQADLDDIRAMHLHPKDVGAAIVSVDEPVPYESWRWGGPAWIGPNTPRVAGGVVEMTVRAADPDEVARRWAGVLGQAVGAGNVIVLDEGRQTVRFVERHDGDREGIAGFVLALDATPKTTDIAGATFEVTTPPGNLR
jgi:hypothetical protein